MFIKSEKHPSPPFTRNYLTHKMLNKKVKGEGLKTLFYIYARQGKKRKGTLGSKIGKTLNKEYNIRHYCPIKKGNSIFETVEL